MEYYLSKTKNEIMTLGSNMDGLEIVILSVVSQRKTNIRCYHLYVESKKMIQMNLFIRQKYRHKNKLMVTNGINRYHYIQNRETARIYCIVQGTILNIL